MAIKKDQEQTLKQFARRITQAPPPITPVRGWTGPMPSPSAIPEQRQKPHVPITGTELMKELSVGWEAIFDWAEQGLLLPYKPKQDEIKWFVENMLDNLRRHYTQQEREDVYFSGWLYHPNDVAGFKTQYPDIIDRWQGKIVSKEAVPNPATTPPAPAKTAAANFLRREGDVWNIGFMGQPAKGLTHRNGFSFIAHLLQRPGESIKDSVLDQIVSGMGPDSSGPEDTATSNGLFVAVKGQAVTRKKDQQAIKQKWDELQDELVDAGTERQEDIQEELAKLEPYMNTKQRNFADPNDKKRQSNMTNRLNDAYDAICSKGMREMAKHLKNNIKTDGAYGRYYSGALTWDITLK